MRASLLACIIVSFFSSACGWEHYWGPYELSVPTAIVEPTDSRTFRLPLERDDREERDRLTECLANTPDRDPPCACDFPVIAAGELFMRLDYRLELVKGTEATVMIWLGRELDPAEPPADQIHGRPRVELLLEHHHRLQAGRPVKHAFGEDELESAEIAWAESNFADCPQPPAARPGWQELVAGVTLEGKSEGAQVRAELVFYLRKED